MKFKDWDGEALKGKWLMTLKIDGFQCIRKRNRVESKNGKPLYNFPKNMKKFNIAEVYCGSWNQTASIVRASVSKRREVTNDEIYPLYPQIDGRLLLAQASNPSSEFIRQTFEKAVRDGYEGLVLRQEDNFIKVKTTYTDDVIITGWKEGKGMFKGMLGKFTTNEGDCGIGFTHAQRKEYWEQRNKLLGTYMEVESMERTKNNKLRNPRFVRLRPDK